MRTILDPLKTRSWVKRRSDWVSKRFDEKLSAITHSLFPDDSAPELTGLLFGFLIKLLPIETIFGIAFSKLSMALTTEEEDKAIHDISLFLGAVNALCYALRVGKDRTQVLFAIPLWQVPCGTVHLLDLDREEIISLLSDAKQTHDINIFKKAVKETLLSNDPEPENTNTRNSPEARKMLDNIKRIVETSLELGEIPPKKKAKAKEALHNWNINMFAVMQKWQAQMEKLIPGYLKAESEFRQSYGNIAQDSALDLFQKSELVFQVKGRRNRDYMRLYNKESKQLTRSRISQAKTTPEIILKKYESIHRLIRQITTDKAVRNSLTAYERYLKKAKPETVISKDDFIKIFGDWVNGKPKTLAINLTAAKLDINPTACDRHLDTAQANRKINKLWFKLLAIPLMEQFKKLK